MPTTASRVWTFAPGRVQSAARAAKRELARMARPAGEFDARRYFRGDHGLRFYNVGTARMRAVAMEIFRANRAQWSVDDGLAFAEALIGDPFLETKSVGIEVLARYRRSLTPRMLPVWKRWLARGDSSNWATTDAICGMLIGPVLVKHPEVAEQLRGWARHRSLWVRRASIVGLIPLARKGTALDLLYDIATTLRPDTADLIHKAAGWALREAGKADAARLEQYLRRHGPAIPRTTLRYAIERFPDARRRALLAATKL